jgi:hypothetical protein
MKIEEEDSEEWYTMDKIIKEEILSLPELQEIITPLYVDKKISLAAELGSKEHEEIEKKLIQYFDSTGLIDPQQEREIFRNMYRKYLEDSFVDEVINGNIDLKYIHAFPLDVRNELEKEFE